MSREGFGGVELCWSRPFALALGLSLGRLGDRGLWLLLLAAGAHELAHLAAIRALGGRVRRICLRLSGMELVYDARNMSYGAEVLAALAGPGCNLAMMVLFGAVAGGEPGPAALFAGCSGVLGLFNLLPALPLDGGRAFRTLLESRCPGQSGGVCRALSLVLGSALLAAGGVLLARRGNASLAVAGGVIFRGAWGKNPLHRGKKTVQ